MWVVFLVIFCSRHWVAGMDMNWAIIHWVSQHNDHVFCVHRGRDLLPVEKIRHHDSFLANIAFHQFTLGTTIQFSDG